MRPGRPSPSTPSAGTTPFSAAPSRPGRSAGRPSPCTAAPATASARPRPGTASATPSTSSAAWITPSACYQHALSILRDLGELFGQADTLTRLGDTRAAAADLPAAQDAWQQALDILQDLRHPSAAQVRAKLYQHHHLAATTSPA